MKQLVTAAVLVVGLAFLAAPANPADRAVSAVGAGGDEYGSFPDHFQPKTLNIAPGDSVTWNNTSGIHNVKFEDGQFEQPAEPTDAATWPATRPKRTFPQAGSYRYYCEMHGATGGVGMSGTIVVGTPATSPGTEAPGSGGGSSPGSNDAVRIQSVSANGPFCNRRGRRCRRPGIRFRVELSARARLTGVLRRRPLDGGGRARRFGTLDFGIVADGPQRLRFRRTKSGRRLGRGRYALTLKAGRDEEVLRFRVVR